MRWIFGLIIFYCTSGFGQKVLEAPLPEKFTGLEETIQVSHFPSPVYASEDPETENGVYFWKHNTAVLASENIEIEEIGAYLYYNDQWNLRASYTPKDFKKWFNCPGAFMKKGEPYTFTDNWRRDSRLYGGWAMWYFIGQNETGKRVYGVGKLYTSDKIISSQKDQ